MISALFFGSIGSIAETSDIQRRAYNSALQEAGLGWEWDEATYRGLLRMNGGRERLRVLADATGSPIDDATIEQIHARKTELACNEVRMMADPLRPGVADLVRWALENGVALGLVTTTYQPNIDAIAEAAGGALPLDRFDVVVNRERVDSGKPAPDAYRYALEKTAAEPQQTLAIEDTAVSALAAVAAGVPVAVTPGAFSDDQVVVGAELVTPSLVSADNELVPQLLALLNR